MKASTVMSCIGVALFASAASAQVIQMTGQDRYIEGMTVSVVEGKKTTTGPFREQAFENDFGWWFGELTIGGPMTSAGRQYSIFNGTDNIQVEEFTATVSGGGGPGTSGTSRLTNNCEFHFTVPQPSSYNMDLSFTCGPLASMRFTLVGPGVNVEYASIGGEFTSGDNVILDDATGNLPVGDYTLRLVFQGEITYVGPGGNGTGCGNPGLGPILDFTVIAGGPSCAADFNDDTVVNSQDFFDFLTAFFANSGSADFNEDNAVNSQDFFDFLTAFFAGC